jgi:bifunctional UDP-N-acetylglucosamine pyrophosphorylase / glucosamine-1-phosphate N-acetyltransferase
VLTENRPPMSDLHIVILAAGKGTRMRSAIPKVLHRVAGLTLIEHVLRCAAAAKPKSIVVVVGHHGDMVRRELARWADVNVAVQEPQLGTGHALLQAEPFLADARGTVVMLSADAPLFRPQTLAALVRRHDEQTAAATVVTAIVDHADGYGRIVRENGEIAAIVEHRDASPTVREIREINSSIYAFELAPLFDALRSLGAQNEQAEYYLPDLVKIYRSRGLRVATLTPEDAREVLGVNSRKELADMSTMMNATKNDALMAAGVTIIDPATTWIEPDVIVGSDTIIHPNVYLEGKTTIGSGCEIHSGVRVVNSVVGDRVVVNNYCVILESRVLDGAQVGPFAHVRPDSVIGQDVRIGNFVELKKTVLGRGSKANHLTYLGDATIGEKVNVGAGTITCNYDGIAKHATIIEDGAFIGSDSQLIAPVRVGHGAYVAAGSTITDDVPPGALAIARSRQVNKEGRAKARKKKL